MRVYVAFPGLISPGSCRQAGHVPLAALPSAFHPAVCVSSPHGQVMDEADFQRESFKLREREYK